MVRERRGDAAVSPTSAGGLRRADAARNSTRILAAAEALLAERGLDVTLDDVAAAAGVGVGTVYRRFANKRELVSAVFDSFLAEMSDAIAAAAADPDPWHGLTSFLEQTCGNVAGHRGFATAMSELQDGATIFEEHREQLIPELESLLVRAKAAGALRPEVAVADVLAFIGMVHSIAVITEPVDPDNWRRYLAFLVNGMRSASEPELPLWPPPLTVAQVDQARAAAVRRK